MEIKGAAVIAIREFVIKKYGTKFNDWINSLSEDSRKIITETTFVSKWYPFNEAILEPLQNACKLFSSGKNNVAWEYGRFIADYDVKSIYKVFLKIASPSFTIKRAPIIFSTYFKPGNMVVVENNSNRAILQITNFSQSDKNIEFAICGWIERTLEIIGCKKTKVNITKSLTKGDKITEFVLEWE